VVLAVFKVIPLGVMATSLASKTCILPHSIELGAVLIVTGKEAKMIAFVLFAMNPEVAGVEYAPPATLLQ
jgi:hypothetical protein